MNTISQDTPQKQCSTCKNFYPATPEFFQRDRSKKDGLYTICKACCAIREAHKWSLRRPVSQKKIEDIPEGMKRCSKCKELLPATLQFFKGDKTKKDGLYSSCGRCGKGQYRETDPTKRPNVLVPQDYKQCSKCWNVYPATTEYFCRHKGSKGYLHPRCKQCLKADGKARYVPKPRPYVTPGYKVCAECGQEKPASLDNFHRSGKNGLTHVCKACWKPYTKRLAEVRAAKPQEPMCPCTGPCGRTLPATVEFFDREGPGLHRRCKKCRQETYRANYHLKKDTYNAHRRVYMDANRESIRAHDRNRRALKKGSTEQHTAEDVKRQYERQKSKCYWCGKKLGTGRRAYHVDHIVPVTRGGSNGPDNLVIACPYCNQSKQDKLPHEWPEGGRLM